MLWCGLLWWENVLHEKIGTEQYIYRHLFVTWQRGRQLTVRSEVWASRRVVAVLSVRLSRPVERRVGCYGALTSYNLTILSLEWIMNCLLCWAEGNCPSVVRFFSFLVSSNADFLHVEYFLYVAIGIDDGGGGNCLWYRRFHPQTIFLVTEIKKKVSKTETIIIVEIIIFTKSSDLLVEVLLETIQRLGRNK